MNDAEKAVFIKVLEGLTTSSDNNSVEAPPKQLYESKPTEYLERLKSRAQSLSEDSHIGIGAIVVWKTGLKNKRYPEYDQPCIVLKKWDPPLKDDDVSLNENLDIQLGFINDDDEFLSFNYDSSRWRVANSQ